MLLSENTPLRLYLNTQTAQIKLKKDIKITNN